MNNIIIHILICLLVCICFIIIILSQLYSRRIGDMCKQQQQQQQQQHFGLSLLYAYNNNNNHGDKSSVNDNDILNHFDEKLKNFYSQQDAYYSNNNQNEDNSNANIATFSEEKEAETYQDKIFFSKCNDDEMIKTTTHSAATVNTTLPNMNKPFNNNCVIIQHPIYDKKTLKVLLEPAYPYRYILPQIDDIPTRDIETSSSLGYCGFGLLIFDQDKQEWSCLCHAPEYLGGEMCNEPQIKMIRENKCLKIAQISNLNNVDVSTFNPFVEGVCVQCVDAHLGYVPVMDSMIPTCQKINIDLEDEETLTFFNKKDVCFFDALNPHLYNSPFNKYVEGYGCVCDYYNGFVEVFMPDISDTNTGSISNACIKIGKRKQNPYNNNNNNSSTTVEYHRTDLAYYCLQNNLKPIQVHTYENLEQPFTSIFPNIKELLIKQRANSVCDANDWMNRHIKPSKQQPLLRTNYPTDTWPIVHKKHLVNQYTRRDETFPISTYRLATGRGFETKHWYESTNDRYMSNAIWSHPIVYTHYPGTKWTNKVTLNPLGLKSKQYYGLTMYTKPGEIVRLDTRGYNQEESEEKNNEVITLPPDYKTEMMDPSSIIYIPLLYNNYNVEG